MLEGYQRRGLANLFLNHLQRVAASRRTVRLYGDILTGNPGMLCLMGAAARGWRRLRRG